MRNYWIRIGLGALAIFVVGFGLVSMTRSFKHKLESSEPISLPIAFVPFKLDGEKLGTIDRVVLLRNDPHHIASVRVVIALNDSIDPSRLSDCSLVIDDVDHLNERSTFRCQGSDTAGAGLLEPFGMVEIKGTSDSFPLLLPKEKVANFRNSRFSIDDNEATKREAMADSIRDLLNERADSVEAAAEKRTDSISAAASRMADSIRSGAEHPRAAPVVPKPPTPRRTTGTHVTP